MLLLFKGTATDGSNIFSTWDLSLEDDHWLEGFPPTKATSRFFFVVEIVCPKGLDFGDFPSQKKWEFSGIPGYHPAIPVSTST